MSIQLPEKASQVLALALIVGAGLVQAGCEKVKPEEERARFEKAMATIDSNPSDVAKITEAQLALKKLLAEKENSALAHAGLVRVELEGARTAAADLREPYFARGRKSRDAALALDERNHEALVFGAELEALAGDAQAGDQLIQKALGAAPDDFRANLANAQVKAGLGDMEGAVRAGEKALNSTTDPKGQARAHRVLAPLHEKNKDLGAAAVSHEAMIAAAPDVIELRVAYAELLVKKGDFDKAIETADGALKIQDTPEAHQALAKGAAKKGIQLFLRKNVEEATKHFELATMHDDKNADAWYGLAMVQRDQARKEKSVDLLKTSGKSLEKALEIDPAHSDAREEMKRHKEFIDQLSQESQTFKRRRRRR
jgi:tetratricopeptide (TPR) repeat protein